MTADCVRERPPFQSQLMDRDELGQWILRKLGAPVWCVELTQDQLNDAIDGAIRWFAAKKGAFRWNWFMVQSGQVAYPLPDEVDTVLELSFTQPQADVGVLLSSYNLLDGQIPYDVLATPRGLGYLSTYHQILTHVESTKRLLSADLDWTQRDRCIYISPVPTRSAKAIYEYKSSVFDITQLPERDHDMLKRYALAQAKITLGLIRGKYSSFPGAQGDQSLNADRLIDMGQEEVEKLEEEISQSGYPLGFTTG